MLEGKAFYEHQRQGLGSYFWQSLLSDIEALKVYAGIHVKQYNFYRMKSKRFPYMIYYEKTEQASYVIAVLPIKRNPSWMRKKLGHN